jgi:hypothetical protein
VYAGSLAVAADGHSAARKLVAADIVEKNVAARGGLEAWRAVKTMTLSGKLGAGGNQRATLQVPNSSGQTQVAARSSRQPILPSRQVEEVQLPFVMRLERPRKIRFELEFAGQTAVQVFDGANGWKLRPFLGKRVVEPYTADELKTTATQADLDGPLIDYVAKGTKLDLEGMEQIEGRDTYKLKLTLKTGEVQRIWIDAKTFLESKMSGQPRRLDGTDHPVEIYMRDYRAVNGLQIPFVLETRVLPVTRTALGLRDTPVLPEKTIIENVVVNPKFDEALFSKPEPGLSASVAQ